MAATALPLFRRGKVREMYVVDDERLLMVASDRVSAFDVIMREPIPGKGEVLTALDRSGWDEFRASFRKGEAAYTIHGSVCVDQRVIQCLAIDEIRDSTGKKIAPKQ